MKETVLLNGVYVTLPPALCSSSTFSFNVFWVTNTCVVVIALCDWAPSFEYNHLNPVLCSNFECQFIFNRFIFHLNNSSAGKFVVHGDFRPWLSDEFYIPSTCFVEKYTSHYGKKLDWALSMKVHDWNSKEYDKNWPHDKTWQ